MMRFLMRNCLKYAQQCPTGIFEKTLLTRQQWYPNQLYGSEYNVQTEIWGIPK